MLPMAKRTGIGLLGGTFDPIHKGHVHLAQSVYDALNLAAIHFIPAAQPLLRETPQATTLQRLQMVELVTKTQAYFKLDDREIKRGGKSYMIDTLTDIRIEYPCEPLSLIIGVDQFAKFDQWKDWQKIIQLAHIIVTTRAGFEYSVPPEIETFLLQHQTDKVADIHAAVCGRILFLPLDTLLISSTVVRDKIVKGENVADLLPQGVWAYVKENILYQ
jgi:nicotinate-nucleotide adenylyltransferase